MHWINHYDSLRNGYNTLVSLKEDFEQVSTKTRIGIMITFEAVQESIAHYATQISKELAERNIYDPKEFQAFLKVPSSTMPLMKLYQLKPKTWRNSVQDLAAQLTPNISKQEKLRIEYKLKVLRPRLKELNRVKKRFRRLFRIRPVEALHRRKIRI